MNINTIFSNSGILADRYLGDTVVLPYSFEQIRIQNNETATESVVNLKLQHLYQNFLYLYKASEIASNVIPIQQLATAGVSATSTIFTWLTGLSTSQFIPLSTAETPLLDQINLVEVINNTERGEFNIFASNGTNLIILNSDNNQQSISLRYNSNQLYNSSNIYFSKINSITFDNNNNLYVLDLSGNNLIKYDASGFLTDDNVNKYTIQYSNIIGGKGTYIDKTQFNNPCSVVFNNPYIYVMDAGNRCVKQYDIYLDWIETYGLYRDLLSSYPVDMKVDYSINNFWVLTQDNKILQYSPDFQQLTEYSLASIKQPTETFRSLYFSQQNPNIFYIISDQNVYKRFVSIPTDNIGKYLFYLYNFNTTETINAFAALSSTTGDKNIVFTSTNSTSAGKFNLFLDNINLYSILSENDFDVYTEAEILVNKDEYLQNWVFNKSLSKLLINHMRLRDALKGKFQASRDNNNNIVFTNARYLTPVEYNSINFELSVDFFIGENEIFQNNIVNRSFQKIYNIQLALLNILQGEIDPSYSDSVVISIP